MMYSILVIQTTEGRKNLECIKWFSPRSFVTTLLWMTMKRRRFVLNDTRFPFLYHKDTKYQRDNQHISILYLTCFHTTFHALRNPASASVIFVMSSGRQDFLILNF